MLTWLGARKGLLRSEQPVVHWADPSRCQCDRSLPCPLASETHVLEAKGFPRPVSLIASLDTQTIWSAETQVIDSFDEEESYKGTRTTRLYLVCISIHCLSLSSSRGKIHAFQLAPRLEQPGSSYANTDGFLFLSDDLHVMA